MPKKLALSEEEIILGFILVCENGEIGKDELVRLYAGVLPSLGEKCAAMLGNVKNSRWSRGDLDDMLNGLPLERRLGALVPCQLISARNITDAYLREGRALALLKRYFRSWERRALSRTVERECHELACELGNVRQARQEVRRLLESAGNGRDRLRRRAAVARARAAMGGDRGLVSRPPLEEALDETGRENGDEAIARAVKAAFPNGLREANAIAVRLVLKRVPRADRESVVRALARVREV